MESKLSSIGERRLGACRPCLSRRRKKKGLPCRACRSTIGFSHERGGKKKEPSIFQRTCSSRGRCGLDFGRLRESTTLFSGEEGREGKRNVSVGGYVAYHNLKGNGIIDNDVVTRVGQSISASRGRGAGDVGTGKAFEDTKAIPGEMVVLGPG